MKEPYLEITFRRGRPLAAYLYLPRQAGDKCCRTLKADLGMIVDFNQNGKPIGIEMTAPTLVTVEVVNSTLKKLGLPSIQAVELAPLKAA